MEQNTQAWLKWRHAGIGASDANIIMGVSKYKKRSQLLLEKQTPFHLIEEKDAGPVAALGHVVEALERPRFEMLNDLTLNATAKQSDKYSFIRASYDGLSIDESVAWEHKLVGKDLFEEIKNGNCPEGYYPQVQQQFFVTPEIKEIHFCAVLYKKEMLKEKLDPSLFERAKIIIKRDDDYIENSLLPELLRFWEEVLSQKNFDFLDAYADKKTRIKDLIKKLSLKEKEIDQLIVSSLKENSLSEATTSKYSFSNYKISGRVTYDYKQMQSDGLDLSKYAKKGKDSYGLKVTRNKE